MIKCTTKFGFACELDENVMDNMELIEALSDDSADAGYRSVKVVNLILGQNQKKELYNHLRASDGRVPVAAVTEAMKDIFESFGQQAKNS